MAEYKGIKGFKVKSLASDPSGVEGEIWYNTAGSVLKYQALAAGTWASGGTFNTARANLAGAGRTHTAGLAFGGIPFPAPGVGQVLCESYDGSTWTEVNDMNNLNSYFTGTGSQTAALVAGGFLEPAPGYSAKTETFNGTSWTETGDDLNTARGAIANMGTTTAALCIAGKSPSGTVDIVENYNGSTWTEVGDVNTARWNLLSATSGTPSAGLAFGGRTPSPPSTASYAITESYDGSTWTEVGDLNTARWNPGGTGTQTDALCFGGDATPIPAPVYTVNTEAWNGTAWTEVNNLAHGHSDTASGGVSSDAFVASGNYVDTASTTSQEWTRALAVKTVTVS